MVLGRIEVINVMCDNCGFVYFNPRPTQKLISDHYQFASSGTTFHENTALSRSNILTHERIDFIIKHISPLQCGKLIDIGCGSGDLLRRLDMPSWEKFGLDPTQKAAFDEDSMVQFQKGKIEDLSGLKNAYDTILCISSLEHYYNPSNAIKIFAKLLKYNGLLFIEVPNSLKPIRQISEFYSFEHLSHFTKHTISKLLNCHGLKIIEFDDNVSVPNLRLMAKMVDNRDNVIYEDDRETFVKTIAKYKVERSNKISDILQKITPPIESINRAKKSIAVYGAGIHTNFLYDIYDLDKYVSVFIDSDRKKWGSLFKSKRIHGPHDIPELDIGGVLISSHDFEKEIFNTIKKYNRKNIPVISCYEN